MIQICMTELYHHGIKGQRWGIRRYQNADGTRTELGKKRERQKTIFVSGSSKTQSPDSEYYRKELPNEIKRELNRHIIRGNKVIVGDAPGIDRQVQDYLNDSGYNKVEVYGPGKRVRYSANEKWKTNPIDAPEFEEGSKEWLAKKDMVMSKIADEGLAVILDEGAKATRKNVERLVNDSKDVRVYELNKSGSDYDHWVRHSDIDDKKYGIPELKKFPMPDADHVRSAIKFFNYVTPAYEKELASAIIRRMKEYGLTFEDFNVGKENRFSKYIPENYLEHYGIKGQKWGVRRYQNLDGTRTSAGKEREFYRRRVQRELKNVDDVNAIVDSLSSEEKRLLGMKKDQSKWIEDDEQIETSSLIAKTFVQKRDGIPVSMIEIWENKLGTGQIAIATNPKYRGTGVTSHNINDAIKWFNSKSNIYLKDLQWNNLKENPKSGQIAEKHGFGELEETDDWEFRVMRKR